jgi:hypothetical protein
MAARLDTTNLSIFPVPTRRAALGSLFAAGTMLAGPSVTATAAPAGAQAPHSITKEEIAAGSFEPWDHAKDEWIPPSNVEMAEEAAALLPTLRVAWHLMYKTKAELEAICDELDDDKNTFERTVDGIAYARQYFEQFVMVLNSAELRILCAAMSAMAKSDPAGFANA